MSTNTAPSKTTIVVTPQNITIVHSNPGVAPDLLTAGGKQILNTSVVSKNPA